MSEVRNDEAEECHVLDTNGGRAIAAYRREGKAVAFTHTEVPAPLEGRGIGSALVKGALADVRRAGLKVVAQCSFVAAYIERHPEERDLLA